MGGKGGDSSSSQEITRNLGSGEGGGALGLDEIMGMFEGLMMQNQQTLQMLSQQSQQTLPTMPSIPTMFEGPTIDWTDEANKLASKTKADETTKAAQRRGMASTISTSPLLEDEDVNTTIAALGN